MSILVPEVVKQFLREGRDLLRDLEYLPLAIHVPLALTQIDCRAARRRGRAALESFELLTG